MSSPAASDSPASPCAFAARRKSRKLQQSGSRERKVECGGYRMGWRVIMVVFIVGAGAARAEPKVDFNRDVRPILSDTCFTCHGPDDAKRKAGLRLDLKDAAFKPVKS